MSIVNPSNPDAVPPDGIQPDIATKDRRVSRRQFLAAAGVASAAIIIPTAVAEHNSRDAQANAAPPGNTFADVHYGTINVALTINGQTHNVGVEPRTTLLGVLRDHLDTPLTGTKLVCDRGCCGACTVDIDGRTVYSCMTLAVDAVGKAITTIEGIGGGPGDLHPIQQAFVDHDALQCGFCTPGFIMSVRHCLAQRGQPTVDQVRHDCAGNLCRCGAHPHIFAAAIDAAGRLAGVKEG